MQVRSYHLTLLAAVCMIPGHASHAADWRLSIARWQADIDGETGTETNPASIEALGVEKNYNNMVSLALDHSVPWLPDLLIAHTDVSYSGDAIIDESFSLGTIFFDAEIRTLSDFELSHTDFTLHYQIIALPIQVNAGLTARLYDGYVQAESELTQPTKSSFEGVLPMAFFRLSADLPINGWHLGGTANVIRYRGDGFQDYTVSIGYLYERANWGLGVNAGYRNLMMDVANFDDLYVDGSLSGSFLEAVIKF